MKTKINFFFLFSFFLFLNFFFVQSSFASETKKELNEVKKEQKMISEEIKKFDEKFMELDLSVQEKEALLLDNQQKLEKWSKEIEEFQRSYDKHLDVLGERAESIQIQGFDTYLEVLFGSKSFSDFVSRAFHVSTFIQHDQNFLDETLQLKTELEEKKGRILSLTQQIQTDLKTLEEEKKKLDDALNKKENYLKSLKRKEHYLEDELKKEMAKNTLTNFSVNDFNGSFIMPASGTLTSTFGPRWGTTHAGIDIAKRGIVPVVAAAPGVVIQSKYSTSFGNVVIIKHNINGKTYSTLYAHLRNRPVSAGQKVKQGQFLGNMGNTGDSTGQHLHFEIHNGIWRGSSSALNPLQFY